MTTEPKAKGVDVLAILRKAKNGKATPAECDVASAAVAELIAALRDISDTASSPMGSEEELLEYIERKSISALNRLGGEL